MKIIVNKQQFKEKLIAVSKVATDNKIRPILGCVKLSVTAEAITLTATDLEITITSDVLLGNVVESGDVTFKADNVIEYIATLGNSITISATENILTISETDNEEVSADFSLMDSSEYPNVTMINGESVEIESEPFTKCISDCYTVSRTVTDNLDLMGVRLELTDKVCCIASDTFRMMYSECDVETESDIKVTVPNNAIAQILSLLKTCAKVEILKSNNQMLFGFGDYRLMTRLIQLDFPSWEKLKSNLVFTKTVTVNTDKAIKTLKRMIIAAKNNITAKNSVKMEFIGNVVHIKAISETCKTKDKIECIKEGKDLKINLNADFLLKYIETVESEAVEIQMNNANTAVIMKGCSSDKTWFLTMPLAMLEE